MDKKIKTISNWLGSGSINVFGLPFAGKDTQCQMLAKHLGGIVISSGDVLRKNMGNKKLQSLLASGEIPPSDMFEEAILPFLADSSLKNKPLIFSEVGRMQGEQEMVHGVTFNSGHPQKAILLLNMSDEDVFKRFEASQETHDRGNRADDNRAVLQTRIDRYREKVIPVIEWYRKKGLLIEIDGSLSKEEVDGQILDKLYDLATKK